MAFIKAMLSLKLDEKKAQLAELNELSLKANIELAQFQEVMLANVQLLNFSFDALIDVQQLCGQVNFVDKEPAEMELNESPYNVLISSQADLKRRICFKNPTMLIDGFKSMNDSRLKLLRTAEEYELLDSYTYFGSTASTVSGLHYSVYGFGFGLEVPELQQKFLRSFVTESTYRLELYDLVKDKIDDLLSQLSDGLTPVESCCYQHGMCHKRGCVRATTSNPATVIKCDHTPWTPAFWVFAKDNIQNFVEFE